jgi:uncharacterized protein
MTRIAVIGGGVAGLSAAYSLRDEAEITIFERNDYIGGHAHTVEVQEGERLIGLDTAFIVFNRLSYPELSTFFAELGVETLDHQGGFNIYDLDLGIQFGTSEFDLDEADIVRRFPESFVGLWREARRFHAEAPRDFLRRRADVPLGQYLEERGYSEDFKHGFVVQLATAVWSIPPELLWTMPASTLIAFFLAHDAEGLGGRSVAWKTVAGGSVSYVRAALARIRPTLRLGDRVVRVAEDAGGVEVSTASGTVQRFDAVVVATHADEALAVLADPTRAQRAVEAVHYSTSRCLLHSDTSVLPSDRSRWRSWNFGKVRKDGQMRSWPVYYLNRLQDLPAVEDYVVTLDCPLPVAEDRVIAELEYSHPIITCAVRDLQRSIYEAHQGTRVLLAGSYFHSKKLGPDQIGSHEAAFSSGREAASAVRRVLAAGVSRATG